MYVIVRDDSRVGAKLCGLHVVDNLQDAHALLRAFQLEYPATAEADNPRIMELHPLSLKPALVESLRITEVPDEHAE